MPYTPVVRAVDQEQIGKTYHIGLGTTDSTGTLTAYGYMLAADSKLQSALFKETTDLHDKDQAVQLSSSQIIDRDLVNNPRVTVADFSGGALQEIWKDTTRFFDSDLDITKPGYVTLRAAWQSKSGLGAASAGQIVAFNNDVFAVCAGQLVRSDGTKFNPGITATLVDTDGDVLLVADGVNSLKKSNSLDPTGWNLISAGIGTVQQMWAVNQGTAGHFLYYTTDNRALQQCDLAAGTIGIAVGFGGTQYLIVDVCPFLTGVAILTKDPGLTGFDVWYFDGLNLTRILRVNQYNPSGMCNGLGTLYVTAQSTGSFDPPVLLSVTSGSFNVVARIGSPLLNYNATTLGQPVSSGQFIYFAVHRPQLIGVSGSAINDYLGVFDILTGAYTHLGTITSNLRTTENPGTGIRAIACNGRAVAFPWTLAGPQGQLDFQTNSATFNALPTPPTPLYAATGWLVVSRQDFNTPSIRKAFRRVTVVHAPLAAGQSITVNAFIDTDPLTFTTSLAVVPAGATVTHSYSVSDTDPGTTTLVFPAATMGRDMFYAIKLTAGTNQLTTPVLYYASTEIAPGWILDFTVDCTQRRGTLNIDTGDQQGVTEKDLYWLLRNAQDDANPMTVYHPNGESYTMDVESIEFDVQSPMSTTTPYGARSLESYAHLTLRKVS